MNDEQKNNLHRLATGLYEHSARLADRFEMGCFINSGELTYANYVCSRYERLYSEHCGTAACAVGWAPVLLGLSPEDLLARELISSRAPAYEDTVLFGRLADDLLGAPVGSVAWNWMFDGLWANVDNSPLGAAGRIGAWLTMPETVRLVHNRYSATSGGLPALIDDHVLDELVRHGIHWVSRHPNP